MEKQQVIAGIKKNIVSILCGLAALVALGFMFFWVSPRISSTDAGANSVKQRVQARKAKADEINSLLTKERPNVQVTSTGPLGMFPTRLNIDAGKRVMEGVKAQANEVLAQAQQVNRRTPLGWDSYESADGDWPLTGEGKAGLREQFKRQYIQYVNAENALFDSETGSYGEGTLQSMLGGTRPPTFKEMQALEGGLEMSLKNDVPLDERGNPKDAADFAKRLAERRVALATGMKYRRARDHRMYVEANSPPSTANNSGFSIHPLATAAQPSEFDCFNAQVGLWVQETVALNLARANEEALQQLPTERQNLLGAPVKHLVSITVGNTPFGDPKAAAPVVTEDGAPVQPPVDTSGIRGGGGRTAPAEQPKEATEAAPAATEAPASGVTIDPTAAIERQYRVSPSGRPLNTPFYDMVPFRVTLRCDAQAVPYVLEQLQAESFLTVLNVEMLAVDPAIAAQQGYVYGDQPVVQLALQCEMPFIRNWLVPLMPDGLQAGLADRAAPPAAE